MHFAKGVRMVLPRVFFAGLVFLGMGRSAWAQGVITASITGKIADASGAAIPETMVGVTNAETGVTRNVVSDAQGDYQVLQLQVGRYDVKAEKSGFKTALQTGIDLVVGQQAVVNITLVVGEVQQVVTVSEDAPLVNTTTATIAGVVGEKAVKELPLNGRSFDNLITLNAGATNVSTASGALPGNGGAAAQQGQQFSVAGRFWYENLFLLNGVEYAGPSQTASEPGGVSGQLLGVDAVREFNVVSDSYGASYGHRAGAQISIATQSGSNQLHGNAFEFIRNDALDSRQIFNLPQPGIPSSKLPGFKRNQFGGSLGGPIQKDKTFVFGNYEGFRQSLNVTQFITVPDLAARGIGTPGGLSELPDVCTGALSTNPATAYTAGVATAHQAIAQGMQFWVDGYYPVPNSSEIMNPTPKGCPGGSPATVASGTANGLYFPLNKVREDFGTTRVDHTFSDKDTLGVIYTIDDGLNVTPEVDPLFNVDISIRAQILSLQETHIFSPTVINSFITGYSRSAWLFATPAVDPNFPQNLLFSAGRNPGQITVSNGNIVNGGGSNATGQVLHRNLFTMTDNVQIVRGRHTIGFGGWAGYLASNELAPNAQSGAAAFNNIFTLLGGNTNLFTFTPVQNTLYWRQWEGAWFVEDNIQLRPNLTFRIGLRHEFTNGYNEDKGNGYNFLYNPNSPGVILTAPVQSGSPLTQNNAVALFAPRMAVAWDPTGKGKTSIRAAGGIYYDTIDTMGQQFLDRTAPLNGNSTFTGNFLSNVPIAPVVPPQCGTPGAPAAPACTTYQVFGVQSFLKIPTVYEWNLTAQQAITTNTSISIAYVGSRGVHQETAGDPQQLFSTFCANPAGCLAGGNTGSTSTAALGQLYVPAVPTTVLVRNPNLGLGQVLFDFGNTTYNGVNVEVIHRFNSGLQFKGAYSYSRSLDEQRGATASGTLTDTYDPRLSWGPSDENQTHRFVFSGGYEMPWGKGKHFWNGANGIADKLVSGWQINWVATVQSGLPFTPSAGNNVSGNGETGRTGNQAPDYNNSFTGNLYTGTVAQWFNPNAYVQPTTSGLFPYVSRNSLVKPGLAQLNFSVFKNTQVNERLSLQFRAEAFNILNNVNLGAPNATAFASGGVISGTAGAITTINSTPRQIQFGLKGIF